ncbi:hypothetical protein FGE12_12475 [Aggregicoccus sp. 17bor-14]|uniref:NTF2 fold immunity protein n=1 Tax=Myxococcaceae TaxID=31 RepID=UPI00129D1004|nr:MULTISPECIES: NTF2 fold immunity protein [Myxococcaceae]MBF5043206.1 hypothetical protein [Simulacricoccus sp. 17bor-14]MRI88963.1 hypothetical protein [Aggregicoccus sp. 17bor-14]
MPQRRWSALVAVSAALVVASSVHAAPHNYVPPEGFVPDAQTAMRIAEAVWLPIYGAENIERQRPLTAMLKGGVWTVVGSLPKGVSRGGVALAEIAKSDARILRVSHGK